MKVHPNVAGLGPNCGSINGVDDQGSSKRPPTFIQNDRLVSTLQIIQHEKAVHFRPLDRSLFHSRTVHFQLFGLFSLILKDQSEAQNSKTFLNRSKSIWPFLSLHVTKLKLGFNPLSHDIWKLVLFFFFWVVTFIPSSILYVLRRVSSLHPGGSPSTSFDFFFLPPLILNLEG